jgi:hypothetical protein
MEQIRTKLLFVLLMLIATTINAQTLKQQLLQQDTTLVDTKIIECKDDSSLFVVILVYQPNWWEDICVLKFQNQKIIWTAKFDTLPTAQSIRSARQIALKGNPNLVIEIFDQTHAGNGSYYLYELIGRKLTLIAQTNAVDKHKDGFTGIQRNSTIFKNEQLKPIYADVNKDGFNDVVLKGTIQIINDDDVVLQQHKCQKVLLYDKKEKLFIENTKLRKGF